MPWVGILAGFKTNLKAFSLPTTDLYFSDVNSFATKNQKAYVVFTALANHSKGALARVLTCVVCLNRSGPTFCSFFLPVPLQNQDLLNSLINFSFYSTSMGTFSVKTSKKAFYKFPYKIEDNKVLCTVIKFKF